MIKRILLLGFSVLFFGSNVFASVDALVQRHEINRFAKATPNIYKLTAKSGVAYQVQTAVGHMTTIDLPEEARKVFVGDADLFKVEVYEKEVIIKPLTDYKEAKSNLMIYTDSLRLTFDLIVGDPDTADFILDFRLPMDDTLVKNEFREKIRQQKQELERVYQKKFIEQDQKLDLLVQGELEKVLSKGIKIKKLKRVKKTDCLKIRFHSLMQIEDQQYLQLSMKNLTQGSYFVERVVLGKAVYKRSLFKRKMKSFIPVEVSDTFQNEIPSQKTIQGLLPFKKVSLNKREKLQLRIYERGNSTPIIIKRIVAEVK